MLKIMISSVAVKLTFRKFVSNISDSFHQPEDREGRPEIRDAALSRRSLHGQAEDGIR